MGRVVIKKLILTGLKMNGLDIFMLIGLNFKGILLLSKINKMKWI